LNLRPSGYEPDELPGCSTPRYQRKSRRDLSRQSKLAEFAPLPAQIPLDLSPLPDFCRRQNVVFSRYFTLARYRLRKPCFRLCITPERRKAAYRGPWYRLGRGLICVEKISCVAFCRPGSDLLSRVLRRSTIGAGAFHGRVRNGNGCSRPAITTRSAKRNNISCFREAGEPEGSI
jgi:hypothetical protein